MAHTWVHVNSAICPKCHVKDFIKYKCQDEGCRQVNTKVIECDCAKQHDARIKRAAGGK